MVFFLLLCLGTACCIIIVDRYQDVGPQLLRNADFSAGLDNWQPRKSSSGNIRVVGNHLTFISSDAQKSVLVSQKIEEAAYGKKFRLRATMASKDIVAGEKEWDKARLLLVQYINESAQWSLPHSLTPLEGTHDWQQMSEVFRTSPESTELSVMVQMSRCVGEFFVKDLSLYEVEETRVYIWVKWTVKTVWLLFVCILFIPRLKEGSTLLNTIIVLTVSVIIVGTTLPGNMKDELKESITKGVKTYSAPPKSPSKGTADTAPVKKRSEELDDTVQQDKLHFPLESTKIAHFCLFALLAIFLLLKNFDRSKRLILLEFFMFACATEIMQFYVDERLPLVTDILIDMGGAAAGLMIGRYLSI